MNSNSRKAHFYALSVCIGIALFVITLTTLAIYSPTLLMWLFGIVISFVLLKGFYVVIYDHKLHKLDREYYESGKRNV